MNMKFSHFGIVVDANGFMIRFVALDAFNTPLFDELEFGETLIIDGAPIAMNMNVAKWENDRWVEQTLLLEDKQDRKDKKPSLDEELTRIKDALLCLMSQIIDIDIKIGDIREEYGEHL